MGFAGAISHIKVENQSFITIPACFTNAKPALKTASAERRFNR